MNSMPSPDDTDAHEAQAALEPDEDDPRGGQVDALLIERTLAGDTSAYDLLVLKYQRRIERLALRVVRGDVALAQDVVQETFLRAWRALAQFRGEAQFSTWLWRIGLNTATRAAALQSRQPQPIAVGEDEDAPNLPEPQSDDTPESILAAQEIARAVQEALAALPSEFRQAITLRELDGLSYEDIAQRMDCPIGTVRSRIFRARQAIASHIQPMLENPSGKRW